MAKIISVVSLAFCLTFMMKVTAEESWEDFIPKQPCPKASTSTGQSDGGKVSGNGCEVIKLNTAQIKTIVDAENKIRAKVASGTFKTSKGYAFGQVKNVLRFKWNDEIADIAVEWGKQCKPAHPEGTEKKKDGTPIGQNVYMQGSSEGWATVDKVVQLASDNWFSEEAGVTKENLDPDYYGPGPVIGHFTQQIHARTSEIGCAVTQHKDNVQGHDMHISRVICNYATAGNNGYHAVQFASSNSCECGTLDSDGLCAL